jgi:cysteine desulfurase
MIYLDNNATTAVCKEAIEAVLLELRCSPSNPSSIHSPGRGAKERLQGYRKQIAAYLGVKPQEILFTSGGTESINLLLKGMPPEGHALSTTIEHASVQNTLFDLQKRGLELTLLPVDLSGQVNLAALEQALRPTTRFIVLAAVNGETGVKQEIQAIARLAHQRHISLFVDAVASLGKEPPPLYPGVSGIAFSGHKCHAPQGTGFVYLRSDMQISPLLLGSHQEYGMRAGSENLPGIAGLAAAIGQISTTHQEQMARLRDRLEAGLAPYVRINGSGPRICNVSNLSFTGHLGEDLLITLDCAGIYVSHGSACASGSLEPSRVLTQMGIPFTDAKSSLRFSLSRYTTEAEIDTTIATLLKMPST